MSEEIVMMLCTTFGFVMGFVIMTIIIEKYGVFFWERWL